MADHGTRAYDGWADMPPAQARDRRIMSAAGRTLLLVALVAGLVAACGDDGTGAPAPDAEVGATGLDALPVDAAADIADVAAAGDPGPAPPLEPIPPPPDLYDDQVLRTLELELAQEDWWAQLQANYDAGTELSIPGDLTVDGVVYPGVGVRFKGRSSYIGLPEGATKASFNLSIDETDPDLRVYGYKTVNLNNAFLDPTFVREALFSWVCRRYLPCPRANHVVLTINGESWGVYVNVEQLNKDFLRAWFDDEDGTRWRGAVIGGGATAIAEPLTWLGPEESAYEPFYEVKSDDLGEPLAPIVAVCDALAHTPLLELEEGLGEVLNVDRALWLLALENTFMDHDGYLRKGADYLMYRDPDYGRIHMLQHDGNESFGFAGQGSWPWPVGLEPTLSPTHGEDSPGRPLASRLLSNQRTRQRYLAHVRTLVAGSLDWAVLGPRVESYQALIDEAVQADPIKLFPYELFHGNVTEDYPITEYAHVPGLQPFVEGRRAFLLAHPEVARLTPSIGAVSHAVADSGGGARTMPLPSDGVWVSAAVGGLVDIAEVRLFHTLARDMPFSVVPMHDDGAHGDGAEGDGVYGAQVPPAPAGSLVRYYVEARAGDLVGTVAYAPARAELDTFSYQVATPVAASSAVRINELMASNDATAADPQGEYDDWIELLNVGDAAVDLSGMFLSDAPPAPRTWALPEGTLLAAGERLLVWADGDVGDAPGLHAGFKLSAQGETLLLVDTDARGNAVLDAVTFGPQEADVAFGRLPDGTGAFQSVSPTPGSANGESP